MQSFRSRVDDYKQAILIGALRECRGKRSEAARHLGLRRTSLQRLIRRYGVTVPSAGHWLANSLELANDSLELANLIEEAVALLCRFNGGKG